MRIKEDNKNLKDSNGELKSKRIMKMFDLLHKGDVINKKDMAQQFDVNEKTIQRDLEEIKLYFDDYYSSENTQRVEYDRKKRGYILKLDDRIWLTNQEVMVLLKILLESRAFATEEMDCLIDKLLNQCVPEMRKHVRDIILNEKFHYVPVKHGKPLFQIMWDISKTVNQHRITKLQYVRSGENGSVERFVQPVGLIFSEYYFYLIAYISGTDYQFPALYRLDRIIGYEITDEHFIIPEQNRFEEGEFRKKIPFMQSGKLFKVQFKFWGESLESILDRLPNARVLRMEGNKSIIEAEVFGRGIKMWLLSQAQYTEVIYPEDFRTEMKRTIEEMLKVYD